MFDLLATPVHPGKEVHDRILEMNMNMSEFARHIQVSSSRVSEIVHGKRSITLDTAVKLADAFDTTPEFWLHRQNQYDLSRIHATN